ncbi:hypothetical protein ACWGIU_31500, partial [Streptomyces sp. NPDC054840]
LSGQIPPPGFVRALIGATVSAELRQVREIEAYIVLGRAMRPSPASAGLDHSPEADADVEAEMADGAGGCDV